MVEIIKYLCVWFVQKSLWSIIQLCSHERIVALCCSLLGDGYFKNSFEQLICAVALMLYNLSILLT